MTRQEIGQVLKAAREAKKMTQKQVAEVLGRRQQIVGHWETGYAQPDANTLFELCDIYGISIDDAFGKKRDTENAKLVKLYDRLDSHGKRVVKAVLDLEYERCAGMADTAAPAIDVTPEELADNADQHHRNADQGTR